MVIRRLQDALMPRLLPVWLTLLDPSRSVGSCGRSPRAYGTCSEQGRSEVGSTDFRCRSTAFLAGDDDDWHFQMRILTGRGAVMSFTHAQTAPALIRNAAPRPPTQWGFSPGRRLRSLPGARSRFLPRRIVPSVRKKARRLGGAKSR